MSGDQERRYLTPESVCSYAGISMDVLINLTRGGILKAYQVADQIRFRQEDVDALLHPQPAHDAVNQLQGISSSTSSQQGLRPMTTSLPGEIPAGFANHLTSLIRTLFAQLAANQPQPKTSQRWISVSQVKALYQIDARRLKDWVEQGYVRKAKLGETLQAAAAYAVEDIEDVLNRLAHGLAPQSALRHQRRRNAPEQ